MLPVLLLAVWQLSVSAGWLSTRILPAPSAVIEAGEAEEKLERAGEYALGLMEGADRQAFEAEMAGDAELAAIRAAQKGK